METFETSVNDSALCEADVSFSRGQARVARNLTRSERGFRRQIPFMGSGVLRQALSTVSTSFFEPPKDALSREKKFKTRNKVVAIPSDLILCCLLGAGDGVEYSMVSRVFNCAAC
jgi:hypothetical protein